MSDSQTIAAPGARTDASFADDVRYYLSLRPRQLPSKYLYDGLGSALFEAITHLPWYSLARAETRLLRTHAQELFDAAGQVSTIVELGPGSGDKLLALLDGRETELPIELCLIDVSSNALARANTALRQVSGITVTAFEDAYEAGLERFRRGRHGSGRTLALFLGSNIGNFDPPGCDAFLSNLRSALAPGDFLLLGTDLVKPERDLLLAYDDPLGVTAAFNLNLLLRINRELAADFEVGRFAHRAVWNRERSRIEMHLVSRRRQVVRIQAADFELDIDAGESIWTESSYKFEPAVITALVERNGFRSRAQWLDRGASFALTLAETC